ncbi:MAG: carboxypeptidase-like regulatory domain-containing protein, partial [Candidatus Zixiibacteriota bacterium]
MAKRKMVAKFLTAFLFFIMAVSSSSFGQIITGKIGGVVTDDQDMPLPGVLVEASSPSAIGVRTAITSDKGRFLISHLEPGIYKLNFTLDGFQKEERKNIKVSVNTTVTIEVK